MKKFLLLCMILAFSSILAPESFDASVLPCDRARTPFEQVLLMMEGDDPGIEVSVHKIGLDKIEVEIYKKTRSDVEQEYMHIVFEVKLDDLRRDTQYKVSSREKMLHLMLKLRESEIVSFSHTHYFPITCNSKKILEPVPKTMSLNDIISKILHTKPLFTLESGNLLIFLYKMIREMDKDSQEVRFYIKKLMKFQYDGPMYEIFQVYAVREIWNKDTGEYNLLKITFDIEEDVEQVTSALPYSSYKNPVDILSSMNIHSIYAQAIPYKPMFFDIHEPWTRHTVPFSLPLARGFLEDLIYSTPDEYLK